MTQVILNHSVSLCFGTRLAPKRQILGAHLMELRLFKPIEHDRAQNFTSPA